MTRAKTKVRPSKRDAILNAMLDVVAERGFHDAPMSLIAERSGASTGVIYHYFTSKEEIIRALYERTRVLELARLLDGFSPEMDPRESFLQSWSNFYRFYREHGREMRFLEQYKSAGFPCETGETPLDDKIAAFQQRFSGRSQGGVLQDWPSRILEQMTVGLVARLASEPAELDENLLAEIGKRVWESVRA